MKNNSPAKNILFLGEYSSGKTALINMILGYPILPEKLTATDLPVIKVSKGKKNQIYLRQNGSINLINSWSNLPNDWASFDYAGIEVRNHPLLDSDICLWDTPGINSTNNKHLENLNKLLTSPNNYKMVYFVIPDKLTNTSIEFLKKWKSKFKDLVLVINIKDVKTYDESRQIEREVKKVVMSEIGSVSIHLLNIGDVCEQFNEQFKNNNYWQNRIEWQSKLDSFKKLIEYNINSIIGEDIFDTIQLIAEQQEEFIDDYAVLTNDKLKQLANENDSQAIFEIGRRLFIEEKYEDSFKYFEKSAKLSNSNAINALGVFFQDGIVVQQDFTKAFDFYSKAADLENDVAIRNLADCYAKGVGVKQDKVKAKEYYQTAAKFGNLDAMYALALHYLYSEEFNLEAALLFLEDTIKYNHTPSLALYGHILFFGEFISKNMTIGISYLERAAEQNDLDALMLLADIYFSEDYGLQNIEKGLTYLKKAASFDYDPALVKLAFFYLEHGEQLKAIELFKKSAELGNLDSKHAIALEYYNGNAGAKNLSECVRIIRELANSNYAPAQSFYGYLLETGEGITKDGYEAVRWYQKAADTFETNGLFNLGLAYYNGDFIQQDNEKAYKYLLLSKLFGAEESIELLITLTNINKTKCNYDLLSEIASQIDSYWINQISSKRYLIEKSINAKLNDAEKQINTLNSLDKFVEISLDAEKSEFMSNFNEIIQEYYQSNYQIPIEPYILLSIEVIIQKQEKKIEALKRDFDRKLIQLLKANWELELNNNFLNSIISESAMFDLGGKVRAELNRQKCFSYEIDWGKKLKNIPEYQRKIDDLRSTTNKLISFITITRTYYLGDISNYIKQKVSYNRGQFLKEFDNAPISHYPGISEHLPGSLGCGGILFVIGIAVSASFGPALIIIGILIIAIAVIIYFSKRSDVMDSISKDIDFITSVVTSDIRHNFISLFRNEIIYELDQLAKKLNTKSTNVIQTIKDEEKKKAEQEARRNNNNNTGGGCFIVTATFNSPYAPIVNEYRKFRDDFLLTNKFGQSLIKFYYHVGPYWAAKINKHPTSKKVLAPILNKLITVLPKK